MWKLSDDWKPAMAHVSLENLNLRNWLFVYCIIRKWHDKITTDYTMLMRLCKKHQDKYGFDTWSSCPTGGAWKILLVDEWKSLYLNYIYVWPDACWTTPGIAGTFHFWGWKKLLQLTKLPTHSKNRDGLLHSFSVNIIIYASSTVVVKEALG